MGFLILLTTLVLEFPIEYNILNRTTPVPKRKLLLRTVIAANMITTVMTAVIERLLCRGHW